MFHDLQVQLGARRAAFVFLALFITLLLLSPSFSDAATSGRIKKAVAPVAPAAKTTIERARQELALETNERSSAVLPTPATVRAPIESVVSPVTYTAMQVGLSLTSYRPGGLGRFGDLAPFDLASLGARPMPTVELRWQPYQLAQVSDLYIGGFASVGYVFHEVEMRAPTGVAIPQTRLHTVKSNAGAALTLRIPRTQSWSVASLLGVGQINAIQASPSALGNRSANLSFGSANLLLQNRVSRLLTGYVGYEYRHPMGQEPEALRLQRHQFLVGVLGSFR